MSPARKETIRKIVRLDTFLRGIEQAGSLHFEFHERGRDGAYLCLDPKTGACEIVSWQESGHNGSEYDRKTRATVGVEADEALADVESVLFVRARDKVLENEENAKRKAEADALNERTCRIVFGV